MKLICLEFENMKKKMSAPNGGARKSKGFSQDPFFVEELKKWRKIESDLIRSDSGEDYGLVSKYGIEEEEAELGLEGSAWRGRTWMVG
jgi:hypothetical protein